MSDGFVIGMCLWIACALLLFGWLWKESREDLTEPASEYIEEGIDDLSSYLEFYRLAQAVEEARRDFQ